MDATAILISGSFVIIFAFIVIALFRYGKEYNEKIAREKQALVEFVHRSGWRIEHPEKGDIEWIISDKGWQLKYDTDSSSDSSTPKLIFESSVPAKKGHRFAVLSEQGYKMMNHPMFKNLTSGIEKFARFAGMKDAQLQLNELIEILAHNHSTEFGTTQTQKMILVAESSDTIYHLKQTDLARQFQNAFGPEKVRMHENNTRISWLSSGLEVQMYVTKPTKEQVKRITELGQYLLASGLGNLDSSRTLGA